MLIFTHHYIPYFVQLNAFSLFVQDAYNLGWRLARVLRLGASPQLLDSYELETKQSAGNNGGSSRLAPLNNCSCCFCFVSISLSGPLFRLPSLFQSAPQSLSFVSLFVFLCFRRCFLSSCIPVSSTRPLCLCLPVFTSVSPSLCRHVVASVSLTV